MNRQYTREQLIRAIKDIISTQNIHSHGELITALVQSGYKVNQSTISRILNNLGVVKSTRLDDVQGHTQAYHLPWELSPPSPSHSLRSLVTKVAHNESTIVVTTSPGAAHLVARILDFECHHLGIIGTIAGDDMIFVAPKSIHNIATVYNNIRNRLL